MKKLGAIIIIIGMLSVYPQVKNIKISGFIKDSKTNESLFGAIILNKETGLAQSDTLGYFSFKLNPGEYYLECKYIGYESSVKQINLDIDDEEKEIFFYLSPKPIEIEKVTISGQKFSDLDGFKTYELQSGDISNIPVFLESDVLRVIQALPGVTSISDLSAQVYLRGGNYDETLITLDGIPVYNPYHLGGICGSFNPDIVDREIIYPSNYPVNYQGVLSGVLSINTKNGNTERLKGIASVGLVSSRFFLEGPLSKGNFIISARRTYPDLLLNMFVKGYGTFPYYFYDFNGKYTFPLDSKNLFIVNCFYSRDVYIAFEEKEGLVLDKKEDPNWGNLIGSFKYNHLFNKNDFEIEAFYSAAKLSSDAKGFSPYPFIYITKGDTFTGNQHININNIMHDISLKSQLMLELTGQDILAGIEYKNLSIHYFWDVKETQIASTLNGDLVNVFFDFAPDRYNFKDRTEIYSAFFSDRIQITATFDLIVGFRGIYVQKIKRLLNSPYTKISYKLSSETELSAGYGKYYEYFFTRRELIGQSYYSPFPIYFIADNRSNIPSSDHYSLGLKIKNIVEDINLEVEGYYKTRKSIYSADDLTETFSYTKGHATGVDILLKKDKGIVNGWLSYTFSRSVKNNNGYKYFAPYDRTHNIKLMLNYNLSERWKLDALWLYSTGLPFTPAIGKYIRNDYFPTVGGTDIELAFGRKNSYRYQDYHRLDVGITGKFVWWDIIIAKPYLQIMNVYNSKNPFNYAPSSNETSIEEGEERGSMIIPTIGITLEF